MGADLPRDVIAVLLDMDGLLLDTERVQMEVGPEVATSLGLNLPDTYFRNLVGVARVRVAELIGQHVGRPIDPLELDAVWNKAMDARMGDNIPLRPGVVEFLDLLDRNSIRTAVATNSVTQRAQSKLAKAGLLDRFDAIVGVDLVANGKPEPDVYLEAARRLGCAPFMCAALDDSDLGVEAALSAGVGTVIQIPDLLPSTTRRAHYQTASLSEAASLLGFSFTS